MVKTIPVEAPPVVPCPRCGEPVTDIDMSAGWKLKTWEGTAVGNYRDSEPPYSRAEMTGKVEPFPDLDSFIMGPCGDKMHTDEAMPVLAAFEEERQRRMASITAERAQRLVEDSDGSIDHALAVLLVAKGWKR